MAHADTDPSQDYQYTAVPAGLGLANTDPTVLLLCIYGIVALELELFKLGSQDLTGGGIEIACQPNQQPTA
jgi:hypothetical protein